MASRAVVDFSQPPLGLTAGCTAVDPENRLVVAGLEAERTRAGSRSSSPALRRPRPRWPSRASPRTAIAPFCANVYCATAGGGEIDEPGGLGGLLLVPFLWRHRSYGVTNLNVPPWYVTPFPLPV